MRPDIIRNLATSLVLHNRVVTSRPKAKAVREIIDRLLARVASDQGLAVRRQLLGYFYNPKAVAKIFELVAPNLEGKRSGFVQLFNLPARRRDATKKTMLVLLPELLEVKSSENSKMSKNSESSKISKKSKMSKTSK